MEIELALNIISSIVNKYGGIAHKQAFKSIRSELSELDNTQDICDKCKYYGTARDFYPCDDCIHTYNDNFTPCTTTTTKIKEDL